MNIQAITHEPAGVYVYPVSRSSICFRIKAARGEVTSCRLVYWERHLGKEKGRQICSMKCIIRDSLYDYFQAVVDFKSVACYLKYFFELENEDEKVYCHEYGISPTEPGGGYFEFLYANEDDGPSIPKWAQSQIFYHIFPERFYNAIPENDPVDKEVWGSMPTRENYMGGDLQGIISKLDYLSELGITCLYINPVFKSPSNHKYDTEDYFLIDPHFGTEEDLRELVDKCHCKGIKVMLDGVFNHCGLNFWAFADVIKNGEKSAYKDWFFIRSFPVETEPPNYECVGHYKYMPKLRVSNPEVRDYFIKVADYWIEKTGIDGWRLDVADEVDRVFWVYFRDRLKEKYPGILLIGESWGDVSRMLTGDQMDSAMNYLFKDAVTDYIARGSINSLEFDYRINHMFSHYSSPVNHVMYNLIDSHDTRRFLFECKGNKDKLKIAVGLQMTFVGMPAIYYGDEIGITGDNDPDSRRAMIWEPEKQDKDLLNWYKKLISIRKSHKVFIYGSFMCNLCDPDKGLYGFGRFTEGQSAYVILNTSEYNAEVNVPVIDKPSPKVRYFDAVTSKEYAVDFVSGHMANEFYNNDLLDYQGKISIKIPRYSIKIIIKERTEV